jgi:GcrA cell cycle regulator
MAIPSTWTDDRIETLTRLWRDGQSASQIARALGGVTRNAVIGKVHRLGLSGRAPPSRPGVRKPRGSPGGRRRLARRLVAKPPGLAAEPEPLAGLADVATVGRNACRWPIGDPKAPSFALCGRAAVRGAYCAAHGARAYRPVAADHLLRLAGLA